MKTCFKCRRVLPLGEFYAHPQTADGHLGKCKNCARRDVGENRLKRRAQYVAYDNARCVGSRKSRRRASAVVWGDTHPSERRVHKIVQNAVLAGVLSQESCRFCKDPKTVAHHEDYSKPLDVWWVCQGCHFSIHAAKRGLTPWRLIRLGAA